MIQFYAPDIVDNPVLPENDSGHCARVLRMKNGDMIDVIDGRGGRYKCRITDAHPRHTMIEIVEQIDQPPVWSFNITVAVAPTKNMDRMEWLVEKLTEIGINRFIPVRCQRSERKEIKRDRLEKIAVSAMKQSLKSVLPEIMPMTPLRDILTDIRYDDYQRYVAYCDPTIPRKLLAREFNPGQNTLVLIGPEGDFAPEEIKASLDAGFIPVTLGDNRLRTETAALVAVDTCHIVSQMQD